ncbi:putative serine protease F56F10.1 [Pseudolycoriella hygida]|uniref:Serine protease F56F10.1 n=1 Tax=Pseudolycoriella hygida TaxID=35572 RepID=A0A9Q0MIP5_9DIPT|nr:putative serine protease F56F10.1 [Pseudolycoriella hygida]
MAKFTGVVAMLTFVLLVEGTFLPIPGLFRGDPFPEPKSNTPIPSNVQLNTIVQRVDNFDPINSETWEQRFYSNNEFYQPGGPIFVFLAGEWDITPYRLTTSLMADIASDLNGNIFYLEHRFYGQSRPTNDTSNANLRFLNTEQALADVAHFVEHVTSEEVSPGGSNSSVIVIGGHYSASLAIWFRQKYPHLCTGAWASSAPIHARVNHQEYKEIAGAAYRSAGGQECYRTIEQGFVSMEYYLAAGRADEIDELFKTCDPIRSPADVALFFSLVSEIFSIIPQFNHIYSVRAVCDLITNGTEPEINRLASFINYAIEGIGVDCLPNGYDYLVENDREIDWDHPVNDLGMRPWSYQLCSQFGWFHSSNSRFQPFGNGFGSHWFYIVCQDVFGDTFNQETIDANVNRFNTMYGGFDPSVTNTIFVHGELDPWRSVGRQADLNPSSPFILIRGGSQGNDLGPVTDADSPQLLEAKRNITEIITRWVREA